MCTYFHPKGFEGWTPDLEEGCLKQRYCCCCYFQPFCDGKCVLEYKLPSSQ